MIESTQTILIVNLADEDGSDYEQLLQQDTQIRYQCFIASSETQILALSESHQFDVIILDSQKRDRLTSAVIESLKAQMGENCPPIIVINRNDARLATRAIKAGAVDYLVRKDLSRDILVQSLQEAISNKQNHSSQYLTADLRNTQLLHDLSTRLVTAKDIQVFYDEIVATAIALTRADAGTVQILEEETQELLLLSTQGFDRTMTEYFYRVNANSKTPCGIALATGDRTFIDFDVPKNEDPDGSLRRHLEAGFYSAQSTPLISRSGKAIGMFSTHWRKHHRPTERELQFLDLLARQAADLIEQQQILTALRESEAKYRLLFDSMDEGYFLCEVIFDENDRPIDLFYIDENPAAIRMTGQSFRGQRLREINPNYEEYWYEIFGRVAQTGQTERLERYAEPDQIWYDFFVFKVDGDNRGRVAVIFRDISDRKHRELNTAFLDEIGKELSVLSAVDEIIHTVGARLSEFLQASGCIFADVDEAKNEATIHHGWNTEDVPSLKQTFRLADYFGEEFARAGRAGETVIVRDTAHDERANAEAYAQLKIGSFVTVPFQRDGRWMANITVTTREPHDWRVDEIELLQEIVNRVFPRIERARAEAALRETELHRVREQAILEREQERAETLAELDRAKTQFFSNISHEFRTPLTLLLAPLEDTLRDLNYPLPEPQRERLELAQRNGLHLLKLVNSLLDFARLEAGRLQANYEPTDLATYTAELASTFRSAIENGGLQLVVDCPPLPESVYVDRSMWEKIVLNLLSNAFKFTFEGTITVSLQAVSEDRVELIVKDTGIGIAAEELPQIFDRFYQTQRQQVRSYEGSGIGLSLVKELVKLHEGEIEVSSDIDHGTTLTVTIPTGKNRLQQETQPPTSTAISANSFVAEAERWLPQEETNLPLPTSNSKKGRILIVDDNADLRNYLQKLLEQDYQVETANNGLAALNKIRQAVGEDNSNNYDLVLADIMMPEMDGFELLRSLRADAHIQEISIILLSARAGEESRVKGLAAGADDYLIKPFSPQELLARVNTHLQLVRMREEATYRERVMEEIQKLNATLEAKVQERTAQLQAVNQELEAFSYAVSHDLQTPLRYISSFAQKLEAKLSSIQIDSISKSYLKIMVEATEQSRTMVQNLLEFSRLGQNPIRFLRVPMDLLVQQVREQLSPQLEGRSLYWQIEALPEVKGDPEMLRLVLQNLLSNAVKYTRDRPKAKITIGSKDSEEEIIFWVRDNGVGFDMKYYDRLFGLFQRLHTHEQFEGTGVGLAHVRRILHRHGGRIWAEAEVDRGAIFYFSLPKQEEVS